MSVFPDTGKLKKTNTGPTGQAGPNDDGAGTANPLFVGGFWLISLLAVVSLVLLKLFGNGDMHPNWAFSVGIEFFSIMASAVVYYCYMQDPDSSEAHTALFAELLVADTVGLFLDEVAWLVQGRPDFAVANIIANALLYLDNCFIVILFWRYGAFMLQIPKKTTRAVNHILSWLCILIEAVLVVNFFKPVLFSVDAGGFTAGARCSRWRWHRCWRRCRRW